MENKDTQYLHAAARVSSLENQLITQQELVKAIEAPSAEEAYKGLSNKELFKGFALKEYEAAFEKNLKESYALIEKITNGLGLTNIFRYPSDGHNLKVLVKAKEAGGDFSYLFKHDGTVPLEVLQAELDNEKFDKLPRALGEAALQAMDQLAKTKDAQTVDLTVDKVVIKLMVEKAEEIGNPLLTQYVKAKVDLININTALRLIGMKKDAYEVRSIFCPGGTLSPRDIEENYSSGYEGINKLIDKAGHGKRLLASVNAIKQGETITAFEQNLDGCFKDLLSRSRIIPFGIEPIIGYLYLKDREIRATRMVLASKVFDIPKEQIGERLRYIYAE
ncbi:MAG: V-type ATPase subunit [Anaerovoracaceae bacterium]